MLSNLKLSKFFSIWIDNPELSPSDTGSKSKNAFSVYGLLGTICPPKAETTALAGP